MVCYHVDIHNEGREGLCSVCVCQVREGSGEREDGEIVGDTIRDQFDRFEIRDCENSSGYLEDPANVAARLTRLPTSTHEGHVCPNRSVNVFYSVMSLLTYFVLLAIFNHCSSTVCCFVDCVGEVFVSSVSPSHIKWYGESE